MFMQTLFFALLRYARKDGLCERSEAKNPGK
jgi:hypothetical protein